MRKFIKAPDSKSSPRNWGGSILNAAKTEKLVRLAGIEPTTFAYCNA